MVTASHANDLGCQPFSGSNHSSELCKMYHSRSCHSQVMCCCFRSAPDAFGGRPVAPLFPGALLFPLPAAAAAPAAAGPLIHVHCRGLLRRRLRRTCLCSRSTRVGQQSTSNRRSLTGFSSASVLCCRCCTTQAVEQKEAPASSRGGLHVGNCASSRARVLIPRLRGRPRRSRPPAR